MSTVRELHQQAMELAQEALILRESGDLDAARALAAQALPLEVQAAEMVEKLASSEPTRSILYQSAASLAFQAGDYAMAQRLIGEGLAGYPPPRVEEELKQLLEEIGLESHLAAGFGPLSVAEMQFAIVGQDVGYGRVAYTAFRDRLETLMDMIGRTARRLSGEPYRRRGGMAAVSRLFTPLISAPQPGSFSVTIQLAQRSDGQETFLTTGEKVIDNVVEGVRLFQEQQLDELLMYIGSQEYYLQFVNGAYQLAPDGKNVTMVGLTTAKARVSFTQSKSALPPPVLVTQLAGSESTMIDSPFRSNLRGLLDQATIRNGSVVGLTTLEGKRVDLQVREGMDDIVRTYFNRLVEVRTEVHGKQKVILTINEIDE